MVFSSTYTRDLLLSRAARVSMCTGGRIQITPDLPNLAKPGTFTAPRMVEFREPAIQLNRLEGTPIQTSTPKPGSQMGEKNQTRTTFNKAITKQSESSRIPKPGPNKATKVNNAGLIPVSKKLGTVTIDQKQALTPVSRTSEKVSWASIVAARPKEGSTQLRDGKHTKRATIVELEPSEASELEPCSTTVLEQTLSSKGLITKDTDKPGLKNVVVPRALRPRVPRKASI